jgi:hypothetical protein
MPGLGHCSSTSGGGGGVASGQPVAGGAGHPSGGCAADVDRLLNGSEAALQAVSSVPLSSGVTPGCILAFNSCRPQCTEVMAHIYKLLEHKTNHLHSKCRDISGAVPTTCRSGRQCRRRPPAVRVRLAGLSSASLHLIDQTQRPCLPCSISSHRLLVFKRSVTISCAPTTGA